MSQPLQDGSSLQPGASLSWRAFSASCWRSPPSSRVRPPSWIGCGRRRWPSGDPRYGAVAKQLGAQRNKLAELQRQVSSAPKLDEQQALRTLQASKPQDVRPAQGQEAAIDELKKKYEEAKKDFKKALKILDDHLEQETQVVQKIGS